MFLTNLRLLGGLLSQMCHALGRPVYCWIRADGFREEDQRLKKLKNQIRFISNAAGGVACKFQIWLAWLVDRKSASRDWWVLFLLGLRRSPVLLRTLLSTLERSSINGVKNDCNHNFFPQYFGIQRSALVSSAIKIPKSPSSMILKMLMSRYGPRCR